jgi:hypothetical protein
MRATLTPEPHLLGDGPTPPRKRKPNALSKFAPPIIWSFVTSGLMTMAALVLVVLAVLAAAVVPLALQPISAGVLLQFILPAAIGASSAYRFRLLKLTLASHFALIAINGAIALAVVFGVWLPVSELFSIAGRPPTAPNAVGASTVGAATLFISGYVGRLLMRPRRGPGRTTRRPQ